MKMRFSPVKKFLLSFMVFFTLIFTFSTHLFADEIVFKCRNGICSAENSAPNTDEIQQLATSVYKLLDFTTSQTNS